MLVLTRRIKEVIQLGEDIKITILAIDSDRVKLGIDAPRSLKVMRAEVLAETKAVNVEAINPNLAFMTALATELETFQPGLIEPVVPVVTEQPILTGKNLEKNPVQD